MGDQVIVELTTLMVFNGSMHRLPLVAYEAPVRSGLILAPIFLIRGMNQPPNGRGVMGSIPIFYFFNSRNGTVF